MKMYKKQLEPTAGCGKVNQRDDVASVSVTGMSSGLNSGMTSGVVTAMKLLKEKPVQDETPEPLRSSN